MFRIIEDASVPRGTVRFEPRWGSWDGKTAVVYSKPDHNVYVNPRDAISVLYGRPGGSFLCTITDGSLHLEATTW